jgi:hypothetical protein
MVTVLLAALLLLLVIACPVTLYLLDRRRRREALFQWATVNGFRLLRFSQPLVEATPFSLTPSNSQHVFKIIVADSEGRELAGFVRLGDMWRGLSSSQAEVRWQ